MNYYFPYGTMPYIENTAKVGLLSKIFKNGINWSTILSNTQKTLNIVNQTIPAIKQIGPIVNNAKTMFRVMNEFKKVDNPQESKKNNKIEKTTEKINKEPVKNYNGPSFFQ